MSNFEVAQTETQTKSGEFQQVTLVEVRLKGRGLLFTGARCSNSEAALYVKCYSLNLTSG